MGNHLASFLADSAQATPDHIALIYEHERITYADLHARVSRLAQGLHALGLAAGDHVALMLPNVPDFTVAYYACHYAGCPVVPLNTMLTADEVAYHLRDSDAVALIAWDSFSKAVVDAVRRVPSCEHLVMALPASHRLEPTIALELAPQTIVSVMSGLIDANDPLPRMAERRGDDTAVILYTSGTTGQAKGAELSHDNLVENARYCARDLVPLPQGERVALATLPLFHSFGQTVVQNRFLMEGGTLVLLPRFAPLEAMRLISEHRVSFFAGVPTMYFAMLHAEASQPYDLSALRLCVSGGAAMPVEVMNAFDARFGVTVLEGYGLSETSPVAAFNVLDRPRKAGSIGLPIAAVEFRLLGDDGREVERGQPGELCIRGPNVMKGYYKRPEANAEAIVDGWFHTGDIATIDDDGYYFIVDRKKDMIIRGGFNVYPREVEEVLYAHSAVREAAVISMPHPSHGEEVCAAIALKAGQNVTAQEIIRHCRSHLAPYKCPRLVHFLPELPKGPTGKILKRALRDALGRGSSVVEQALEDRA